tara:strand:- start:1035 stop:1166 length:132 start_codon:yes stop_codon:yes gene_type:complete
MEQEYDVVASTYVEVRHLQSIAVIDLIHTLYIVVAFIERRIIF